MYGIYLFEPLKYVVLLFDFSAGLKEHFVKVDIYYDNLNFYKYKEKPSMTVSRQFISQSMILVDELLLLLGRIKIFDHFLDSL